MSTQDGIRILSDSESPEVLDELRPDIRQNINGHLIEVLVFETKSIVTIDGRVFNGSFTDAVTACAKLPIRWNGIFS